MNKVETLNLFLKQKGLNWSYKEVYDDNGEGLRPATEKDFNKDKIIVIPVTIPKYGIYDDLDLVLSVDLISFISYGLSFETPTCFAVSDEFKSILEQNNLSDEWQTFCVKTNGIDYKDDVEIYLNKLKKQASDDCQKQTLKHINAIKEETKLKKSIFSMIDDIKNNIDSKFNELEL